MGVKICLPILVPASLKPRTHSLQLKRNILNAVPGQIIFIGLMWSWDVSCISFLCLSWSIAFLWLKLGSNHSSLLDHLFSLIELIQQLYHISPQLVQASHKKIRPKTISVKNLIGTMGLTRENKKLNRAFMYQPKYMWYSWHLFSCDIC